MIKKTLGDIAQILGSESLNDVDKNIIIEGVSTDSRNVGENQLFIPLVGDNFDGHDFIDSALANGAKAVISSKDLGANIPTIRVEDTLLALQDLARAYIKEIDPFIISVTGSNGKTSTKDILSSILSRKYKTHKTQGNFNNYIGLPLTILSMDEDVEIAILEMGIDHFGEMDMLSKIANPNIGIITNAGEAHLDDLGTTENVARAKMEFLNNMQEDASYFYFKDDLNLDNLAVNVANDIQTLTYGTYDEADFKVEIDKITDKGSYFYIKSLSDEPFFVSLIGEHQVYNAAAAVSVANFLELSEEDIRFGLENVQATGMRNEIKTNSKLTILDDSYKSNPSSLKAALNTLYSLHGYDQKIAIIGDMLGIGDDIEAMHREIGKLVSENDLDYIIGIGYYSEYIIWEAEDRFGKNRLMHFEEKPNNIKDIVYPLLKENPIILVKASRPLELDTIVRDLLEE